MVDPCSDGAILAQGVFLEETRLGYFVLSPPSIPGLSQFLLAFRIVQGAKADPRGRFGSTENLPPLEDGFQWHRRV